MHIFSSPSNDFSGDQYLLGDSGYPLTSTCITPYRKPYLENSDKDKFTGGFLLRYTGVLRRAS